MSKRIYVGNLPFSTTQEQLKEMFASYGELEEANIVTNKFSGRSKGFGFIEFKDESAAEKAISEMNKKEVEGREIIVKEAVPFDPDKPRKPRRSFNRGGRNGGFRGRRDRDHPSDNEDSNNDFSAEPQ